MSTNVKSLFIGAAMLIVGLILMATGQGVEVLVFTLDKVGIVLAVLGAIELVITGSMMIFPSRERS